MIDGAVVAGEQGGESLIIKLIIKSLIMNKSD
jgi:hypothetical protein